MAATRYPGWLPMPEAALKYRFRYEALRRLVRDGVFTVGTFSAAKVRPPKYLKVAELNAWKRGGAEAVAKVREQEGA